MDGSAFEVQEVRGVSLVRCLPLAAVPGVAHAFSTRRDGGGASFDLGGAEDGDPGTLARRERFLSAAGIGARAPATVRQAHGSRVVRAADATAAVEADAVVWLPGDPPDLAPSVRTADCVPILIADRDGRAFAAVHSGWRGTVARIAPRAVDALAEAGFPPDRLIAALGPAILRCCYEVGPEVAERVGRAISSSRAVAPPARGDLPTRVDLHAAVRAQLEASGVLAASIHAAPFCVRCRDDLFFSHRREGTAAGRMMASIGIARGSRPLTPPR